MNTKMKWLFFINLAILFVVPLNAQECKVNFDKGEYYRQKGQYEKAKNFWRRGIFPWTRHPINQR